MHPLAMPLDSVLLPRSLRPLRLELWWSRACLIAFVVPVALGAFGDPDCLELEDLTIACLSFAGLAYGSARIPTRCRERFVAIIFVPDEAENAGYNRAGIHTVSC